MHADIVILGAGIIGANCAYALAKEKGKVLLLDKHQMGLGASAHSAAMLEFQLDFHRGEPFNTLAQAGLRLFPPLHNEIKNLTGLDFELEECGIIQLAFSDAEASQLKLEAERQKKMGLKALWLSPHELKLKLPALAGSYHGGIFYMEDGQVNDKRFLSALLKAAEQKGAQLIENVGSVSFVTKGNKTIGIKTQTQIISADYFVVTAGAFSDQVLDSLNVSLGIEPVRGQLLVFETPQRLLDCPVYTAERGYLVPKNDGVTLVGTTVEKVGFDESTTPEAEKMLRDLAHGLLPQLKNHRVLKTTAGLRPQSPDGLPIIGPLPHHQNVFVATGHYRNGILLAPITGKLIADLVLRRKGTLDLTPFSPSRLLETVP